MEDGHPVVPSEGRQQMLPSQVPVHNEEPRTEADLLSVVGDEEKHHEKKPMMTRMKDKMRRMKDSMTKKKHGPVDHHDVHVVDDEHSVETEGEDEGYEDADEEMEMEPEIHRAAGYESATSPHCLGGGRKPFTTDHRYEPIDQDSLGRRDDPLPLSSRDQDVPLGGLGSRDQCPVERATLGGSQEPPVTPETINYTALVADPVDPLPNGYVSRTDNGDISVPKTGSEQCMLRDVVSSFQDMDVSSDVEKKPSHTEKLSTTAAGVKEGEEKPSYTEKLTATAAEEKKAVASTVYAKVAGGNQSGETHDQIATPVSAGPGVEVEPREGAGDKDGTYMEQLTGAAWAVYGMVMGAGTAVTGTEQEKRVPVLAEKLPSGEDDRALCEVISESMKKKGVEEYEVVEDTEREVKGKIVLPEVTAGETGLKRAVGKEGGGDGGKGMMGMFNRAVSSMVGGDGGSGGLASAAEGPGADAAVERAHDS